MIFAAYFGLEFGFDDTHDASTDRSGIIPQRTTVVLKSKIYTDSPQTQTSSPGIQFDAFGPDFEFRICDSDTDREDRG